MLFTRGIQRFPYNLFDGESCIVGIGEYVSASYIAIQRSLHYSVSIKRQEMLVIHYFPPP